MKIFPVGVLLTVVYFVVLLISMRILNLSHVSSYNELGDFLAGVFSPVAFLWLVLGFLQQQKELQQNTKALKLQADELKNSVEQYKKMVTIAQNQLDADLTVAQQESIRRENELKPSVKLKGLRFISHVNYIYTFDTEVLVDGREAKNVEIEFVNGFGKYNHFKYDSITKSFTLGSNPISSSDLPQEVVVLISFESIIGIKYKHQYKYYDLLEGGYQNVQHQQIIV